jgi:hypothetical protein
MPAAGIARVLHGDGVVGVEVIDVVGGAHFREDAFAGQRLRQLSRQEVGSAAVGAVDDQDSGSIHRDLA